MKLHRTEGHNSAATLRTTVPRSLRARMALTTALALLVTTLVPAAVFTAPVSATTPAPVAVTWGVNWAGPSYSPGGPVDMSGVQGGYFTKVTAGQEHACGLSVDGFAYCWGVNGSGQLGDGTNVSSLLPVAVDTGSALAGKTLVAIDAGRSSHTCALDSDGAAYCWGAGGRLGNNPDAESHVPVAVDTGTGLAGKILTTISAGGAHTCALTNDGTAYCWGYGLHGERGDGLFSDWRLPAAVNASSVPGGKFSSIVGGDYHTCGLANGAVYCWGYNQYGALGNGGTTDTNTPVAVDTSTGLAGKTITAISAGFEDTCALTSDGAAYCWGYNSAGQLGDGTKIDSSVPVAVDTSTVLNGKTLVAISASDYGTCALDTDGAAYCWGGDTYSSRPVVTGSAALPSGAVFTSIHSGYRFVVALTNAPGGGGSAPAAPTGVTVTPGNRQLTVAFAAPAGTIIGYRYSTDSGTTWMETSTTTSPLIISSPSSDSTTSLTNGTQYQVQLRAVNAVGPGSATTSVAATPRTVPGAPNITTAVAGDAQVTVTWSAPSDTGGATVETYTVTSSGAQMCTTSALSCVVTGLVNGTPYTFTVTAENAAGIGVPSSASGPVTPQLPATVPDAPTGLTATPSAAAVTLEWVAPNDGGAPITRYGVVVSTSGGTYKNVNCAIVTTTSCLVSGLANATSYSFKVRAGNLVGWSAWSDAASATTPNVPGSVGRLTVKLGAKGSGLVTVNWSAASGATGYEYRYRRSGSPTWSVSWTAVDSTSKQLIGLTSRQSYDIEVHAMNGAGAGVSSTLTFKPA